MLVKEDFTKQLSTFRVTGEMAMRNLAKQNKI